METQKQDSAEMDLGNLLAKVGSFFVSVFYSIAKGVALFRRASVDNYKLLFLMLILFGGGGSYYAVFMKKKFYESTMILSSGYLNKRIVDNTIKKLNKLAGDSDKKGLKMALGINDSTASNLIMFTSKPFIEEKEIIDLQVLKEQLKNSKLELENPKVIDEVIKRLEIENQHAFEITVRVYNPQEFLLLEKALVSYFKSTGYVNKRLEISRKNLISLRNKLDREGAKLDSLKMALYDRIKNSSNDKRDGSNNVIFGQPLTNPMEIFNLDLNLYNQKLNVEREMFNESDFEVVDGFTQMNVAASAPTSSIIRDSLLLGLVVGYLILAARKINSYLSKLA